MSIAIEPETATFYCAREGKGSNMRVYISGGEKHKDGAGKIFLTAMKEAQFNAGIYHTSDPEVIATLRRRAKDVATCLTEDYETYLEWVTPPEKQVTRLKAKLAAATDDRNRLIERTAKRA